MILIGLTSLSALVEHVVEAFTSGLELGTKYRELVLRVLAVGVGLLLAFGFHIDYSNEILGAVPVVAWVGYVFTGILVGVGGSVVHDILEKYGRK